MNIGTKVRFYYLNKLGIKENDTLVLSSYYETDMDDNDVKSRLDPSLQKIPLSTLISKGCILAARCLLKKTPDATKITMEEVKEENTQDDAAAKRLVMLLVLAILALLLAIICLPIFVILGLKNKLFLRNLYKKCQDNEKYVKWFTISGIGVYGITLLSFAIGKIFKIAFLETFVIPMLLIGGITYFIISLIVMKKKFMEPGEKLDLIKNIKSGFKKKDKDEVEKDKNKAHEKKENKCEKVNDEKIVKTKKSKNEKSNLHAKKDYVECSLEEVANKSDNEKLKEKNAIQDYLDNQNDYFNYLQSEISKEEKKLAEEENEYIKANIQSRLDSYKKDFNKILSEKKVNDYILYLQNEIAKEEENLKHASNDFIKVAIEKRIEGYKEEYKKVLEESGKADLLNLYKKEQEESIKEIVEEEQEKTKEETVEEEQEETKEEKYVEKYKKNKLKETKIKKEKKQKKEKNKKKKIVLPLLFILIVIVVLGALYVIGIIPFNKTSNDIITINSINYQLNEKNGEKLYEVVGTNDINISGEVTILSQINGDIVESIASKAFSGCTSITKISIPGSIINIGMGAFENCTSLTSITLPFVGEKADRSSNNFFGFIFGSSSRLNQSSYIPKSLKTVEITNSNFIANGVFSNCNSIEEIKLSNEVTTIGESAFSDCELLSKIIIPNSVTSIGQSAFYGCISLTKITMPNSVKSIEDYTFYECTSLMDITLPDSITTIGASSFYGCKSLKSIIIPESVTMIESYAFCNCESLEKITLPKSMVNIGKSAFSNCTSLTSITIPKGVKSIEDHTFYGCTSLKNIILPESITIIGAYSFYNCESLIDITIPDKVTTIGTSAFYNCKVLKKIIIPVNVTSMGYYAFGNCSSLKIYCEIESWIEGWSANWNPSNREVEWNYFN